MENEEEKVIQIKVVLVGESGVGKTSIITRYTTNSFSQSSVSTPGASFTTKIIIPENSKLKIKFELWDTAGQEKYRALTKIFYKNISACLFVYDITKRKTFDEVKNYWLDEVRKNGPKDAGKNFF